MITVLTVIHTCEYGPLSADGIQRDICICAKLEKVVFTLMKDKFQIQ